MVSAICIQPRKALCSGVLKAIRYDIMIKLLSKTQNSLKVSCLKANFPVKGK